MGMALLAGCGHDAPLAPADGAAKGGTVTVGNNLSVPVFFAEGIGLSGLDVTVSTGMPGDAGDVWGEAIDYLGVMYYLQQTSNIWQADWVNAAGTPPVEVASDWADCLTHQIWDEHSIIRTEVVLFKTDFAAYQAAQTTPLTAYLMNFLYGDGLDEVWGTPLDANLGSGGTIIPADAATVYSSCARMMIQKLAWPADITNVPTGIVPDTYTPEYEAYVASTFYNSAVYDRYGVDGITGAYSAELNVPGKVIYGYNWDLAHFKPPVTPKKDTPGFDWVSGVTKVGWWRLTFSFDPSWDTITRNAAIKALDPGDLDDTCDFHPVVVVPADDPAAGYTYLDIYVND
ncbi:MAG: hypothetical protein ACYDIE_10470 [Candidatus Krumholzibacteriia bacterium]